MINITELKPGMALPERQHTASNVSLFMYNAAVWNHHRIHYDVNYTKDIEGHPDIVIDGPLQGDWLSQVALNWLGDAGQLLSFEYTNRQAAYLGETLTSGGIITEIKPDQEADQASSIVTLDLFIRNESGQIITPGNATVRVNH